MPKEKSVKVVFLIDLAPCVKASLEDWYLKKILLSVCKIFSLAKCPSLLASEDSADANVPAQVYWGYRAIHSDLPKFQEKRDFRECSTDAARILQLELIEMLTTLPTVEEKHQQRVYSRLEYLFSCVKGSCLDFNWKSIILVEHEPFELLSPIKKRKDSKSANFLYLFASSNIDNTDDPKERLDLLNYIQVQYVKEILSQKRIGLTWFCDDDCLKLVKDNNKKTNNYGKTFLSEIVAQIGGNFIVLDEVLITPPKTPLQSVLPGRKHVSLSLQIFSKCICVEAFPMGFVDSLLGSINRRNYTLPSDSILKFSGFYRKDTSWFALRTKGVIPLLITQSNVASEESIHFLTWLDSNRSLLALFYHPSDSSKETMEETYVIEPLMSCMAVMFQVENSAMNMLHREITDDSMQTFTSSTAHSYQIAKAYEQLFHFYSLFFQTDSDYGLCKWYCFGEDLETSSNTWEQQTRCYANNVEEQVMELNRILKDTEDSCLSASISSPKLALKESNWVPDSESLSSFSFVNICHKLLQETKTREEIQKLSSSALESLTNIHVERQKQVTQDIQKELLHNWSSKQSIPNNKNEKNPNEHFSSDSTKNIASEWTKHWIQLIAHIAIAILECQDPTSKKNIQSIERSIIALQELSDDYNQLSEAREMLQFIILKNVKLSLPQTASYLLTSFDLDESEQREETPTRRNALTEENYKQTEAFVLPEVLGTIPHVQGKGVLKGDVTPRTKAFLSGEPYSVDEREPCVSKLKKRLTQEQKQRNRGPTRISSIREMKTIHYREVKRKEKDLKNE